MYFTLRVNNAPRWRSIAEKDDEIAKLADI
jgi:hypothetical protein